MNNKKQISALMDEAQSLMRKVNSLIIEANELAESSNDDEPILAEYNNKFGTECTYWDINEDGEIEEGTAFCPYEAYSPDEYNYFNCFWDQKYAEQSKQLTAFNNKLLAFKWCYDRDYEPVFSGDYGNRAYYVYYDSEDNKYDYDWQNVCHINVIYFSSKEIAQKCCDWLNSLEEG